MNTTLPHLRYTALIRTFNSGPLIEEVVRNLRNQTLPPEEILAVDSGSSPEQLSNLRTIVDVVVDVSDREFNYSRSINAGLQHSKGEYILIISSHVMLRDSTVIADAWNACQESRCEIVYLIDNTYRRWPAGHERATWWTNSIGTSNFDGENGLSNSCGLLPKALGVYRPFREEVFSAEDQEWSAWYYKTYKRPILRIETSRIGYLNKRLNYAKLLNEELAIACFIEPSRRGWLRIGKWLLQAAWSIAKADTVKARFRFETARALWMARSRIPAKSSKYF